MLRIEPVSETALMVRLGDRIDPVAAPGIGALSRAIREHFGDRAIEVLPSYASILVQFDPQRVGPAELENELPKLAEAALRTRGAGAGSVGKRVILPVYYHPEVAPDLEALAKQKGLSIEDVIAIHSGQDYAVCAIGFAPGFAFLAEVDERIAWPRHAKPRVRIPRGSVGIADRQTAVYPDDSPGGWQIIGNCPATLFNPTGDPMMPFAVGDTVRFEPVSKERFLAEGGQPCRDWK